MPRSLISAGRSSSGASSADDEEQPQQQAAMATRATRATAASAAAGAGRGSKRRRVVASSEDETEHKAGGAASAFSPFFGLPPPEDESAPAAAATASASPDSPAAAPARRRLRRAAAVISDSDADVDMTAVSSAAAAEATPAAAAAAPAGAQRPQRRRLRGRAADSESEYEEEAADASDAGHSGDGSYAGAAAAADDSASPRVRYRTRTAQQRKVGLSPTRSSAMQRLLEDRRKANAAAAAAAGSGVGASGNSRRKRLFQGSSARDSERDGDVGVANGADAEEMKRDKYARVEALIRSGSELDEDDEEEDGVDPYFARIKGAYDPVAEARELRRKEKEEEEWDAQKKLAQATSDEAFERWQEREAKKKQNAGRIGKGTATRSLGSDDKATKTAKARKRRLASKMEKEERMHDYDDGDDFVARDDEVEYLDDDADGSAAGSGSGSDTDGYEGPRFDEDLFRETEQDQTAKALEATMPPREAFDIWAHHLCAAAIDEGWSGAVDRDREMRLRYQAAEKVVEESFNLRAAQWVFSATWNRAACAGIRDRMNTLCYTKSEPPHDNIGCEVCLPRKGYAHACTHTLGYFGVSYDPAKLRHPFKEQDIILSSEYEEQTYNVGQLCHQRLRLYHVMRHFKLHVMLSLKARLKDLSKRCFQSAIPASKVDAYRLLNDMFRRGSVDSHVGKQFHIWERLNSISQGYSLHDTRKTYVDLDELAGFQNFDHEECLLELFNWRHIGSQARYDSEALEQLRALKKKLAARPAFEANGNGGGNGAGRSNRNAAHRRRNPAAPDDDVESEYELDEEAEAEAEEALRKADAGEDDESDEDIEPVNRSRRPSRRVPPAVSPVAPAAAAASAAAAAASPVAAALSPTPARAASSGVSISGWIRKANRTGSNASAGAPPSSIESIQDLTSDTETGPAAASARSPSQPSSARKRGPPALPLSRVTATSPPRPQELTQRRTPPSSAGKLQLSLGSGSSAAVPASAAAAPARSPDGESVHAAFKALSAEEQVNFMQLLGESAQTPHATTFIRAVPRDVQLHVAEALKEIDDLAM